MSDDIPSVPKPVSEEEDSLLNASGEEAMEITPEDEKLLDDPSD